MSVHGLARLSPQEYREITGMLRHSISEEEHAIMVERFGGTVTPTGNGTEVAVYFGALPPRPPAYHDPFRPTAAEIADQYDHWISCPRHPFRAGIDEQDASGRVRHWCVECWINYIWPIGKWRRRFGRVLRRLAQT